MIHVNIFKDESAKQSLSNWSLILSINSSSLDLTSFLTQGLKTLYKGCLCLPPPGQKLRYRDIRDWSYGISLKQQDPAQLKGFLSASILQ